MTTTTVDKSGDRVKRMFGQIAGRYDLLNHVLSCGIDILWRRYTVKTVAPQGTAEILDVCTGTGDLAIEYWKAGKGRIAVQATDFTPEMLVIAREKFAKLAGQFGADAQGIAFAEADTQHLPFEDDRFQIVSVAFGIRNVTDTRAGIREMIRVCQPGGRVAILEFSQPHNSILGAFYRGYFKYILPRVGQSMSKNQHDAYNYLPASVAEFPCGEALAQVLRDVGLVDVKFTPLTLGIATLYVGTKAK